jgi:glyoxylase-like metal-dependent hydrolase (beta-lactamase superfamily II)
VVVDPGSSVRIGEMVLARIAATTRDPVIAVFNTHVHGDHWLGNQAIKAAFPKAVIYAHPNMKAKAAALGPEWVGLLNRLTDGAVKGTEPVVPDTHVDHDEVVKLGDRRFRIYHQGKAHTDGDIMIEVVEEQLMFLGDNVFAGRIGRMDDGHFGGNVAAIEMALKSDATRFVPGHGPANGRDILIGYRDYLRTVHDEVKRYYEQGLQDFEMKPKIAEALGRYRNWYGFNDELGRHISLAYQQVQAESF